MLIYLLLRAMQLFMGSAGSRLESAASISLQLCLWGDQRCLWQWMNSVEATVHYRQDKGAVDEGQDEAHIICNLQTTSDHWWLDHKIGIKLASKQLGLCSLQVAVKSCSGSFPQVHPRQRKNINGRNLENVHCPNGLFGLFTVQWSFLRSLVWMREKLWRVEKLMKKLK